MGFFRLQEHHRPLRRHRFISLGSFFLHLTAFILLLLVGLSLTIIKPVYLVVVRSTIKIIPATSIATELRFGVWGICATSVLNSPTPFSNHGDCIGPKLGYSIPPAFLSAVGVSSSLANVLLKGLQIILILHIVAASLACAAFIVSLFLISQVASIIGLVLSICTGLVASTVLAADLALVIVVRNKVRQITNGFEVEWGNGIWMVLAAVICTWLGVVVLSARTCYCCGIRRKDTY